MSAEHYFPEKYKSILSLEESEKAIADIKTFFQTYMSAQLKLRRVTAPLFLESSTGLNDDLNGVEKPVSFNPAGFDGKTAEIVQSLAKWKRMMLGFEQSGILMKGFLILCRRSRSSNDILIIGRP